METIKCIILGAITQGKGYDRAIAVIEQNPKIELLIVGPLWNPAAQPILDFLRKKEKKLKNLKVEARCLDEKEFEIYAKKSDIILFPYHIVTGSGMFSTMLRYMKPIITWNLPLFQGYEKEYNACITVNSIKELEDKILEVYQSKKLKEKLRKGAKKLLEENSWENIAKRHIEVYKKL